MRSRARVGRTNLRTPHCIAFGMLALALSVDGQGTASQRSFSRTLLTHDSQLSPNAVLPKRMMASVPDAYVKASNTGEGDLFGDVVALSGDGTTMAIGAWREDSNAVGINGNQADNTAQDSGAVYIYILSGTNWIQQAYIKASNTQSNDQFGWDVKLSRDGNMLAVSALFEASGATGVGGDQLDNSAPGAGAVYIFSRVESTWSQQAYIKAINSASDDYFGDSIALSADGNALAVGASNEDSGAVGIDGDPADNSASQSGATYIYTRSEGAWVPAAYIKSSNTGALDGFGRRVALDADGSTLVVAAPYEDSNATGIDGEQNDNSALSSGAVYAFVKAGNKWVHQAYIKASNTEASDGFGHALSLSGRGNVMAVSAVGEDSNATGIGGNQSNNTAPIAGAAYVFAKTNGSWSQQSYVKASNTGTDDHFGVDIQLSSDGRTMAVGAQFEDSGATGIGGNQGDNSTLQAGAVYTYVRMGSSWRIASYIKAPNTNEYDTLYAVAVSDDGNTILLGAPGEDSNAVGVGGDQSDNSSVQSGAAYVLVEPMLRDGFE